MPSPIMKMMLRGAVSAMAGAADSGPTRSAVTAARILQRKRAHVLVVPRPDGCAGERLSPGAKLNLLVRKPILLCL